jgi:PEGA domain
VGAENQNPLEELKSLDQQVERVTELEDLKPIFFRLDDIARAHSDDFEVQLVVGDIKQHLVNRGTKIKEQAAGGLPPTYKPLVVPPTPPPLSTPLPPTMKPPSPASGPPGPPPMSPPAPANPDAPTVRLSPRPVAPAAGPPPRSPLDGPAPLSELKSPPELKQPKLMSSGQFSTPPKPPSPPPVAPPAVAPPGPPPIAAKPPAPPPQHLASPPAPKPIPPPRIPQPLATNPQAPVRPQQPPQQPPPQPRQAPTQQPTMPMPGASFGATGSFGSSAGPLSTGPQTPAGLGAAPPSGPPKQPQQRPTNPAAQPPKPAKGWRRPLLIGVMLGALFAIVTLAFVVNQSRKRNKLVENELAAEGAAVQIQMTTTPANASIRVNGETKCNAPCSVALPAGSYQVTAFLDGYDPATSPLVVYAKQPGAVNMVLSAQPQSVRILTDLEQGKLTFDDQAPVDLQEGQFILDKVAPGSHTVKITGKSGDAMFTFDIAEAKPPVVTGNVTAHNLVAVLVSSFGSHAHVVTNSGPMKLSVNGQPEDDAVPTGVDLKAFQPGVDELIVGDGKDQHNMKESFGPAPMLTAFLKSDLNIGTLIVSTGQDDVKVFLNDKEYRRKTQRGQLRIPVIGKVKVFVQKDGFQPEPPQNTEVKKGAEVRLEFKLKALPTLTTLLIRSATPGAEVLIDQASIGTVGADGNLTYSSVAPGDHTIELRRDQYTPKRLQRTFRAGTPVALVGSEVTLAAATPTNAIIRVARTPANATITYRRAEENESRELRAPQVELPPGGYVFTAKAPGYTDRTERVQVAPGESRTIEIALTAVRPTTPAAKNGDVTDFEESGAWKKEGDLYVHKGGGFVPYKLGPRGLYTFTVELVKGGNLFRGGRIRWAVQYLDSKDYLLFELDRKTFWASVVEKGKKLERQKTPHQLENQKSFTIQIEITPEHVVHKLKTGDSWLMLDSFAEPGRNFTSGKFGFFIQGADEIGISDFTFVPK